LSHAESDLRLARLGANDPQILSSQVCFHAQQAAEKSIKAILLFQGIEFPLTHDLEELLEIAEDHGMAIPAKVRQTSNLTPYAVETRYPGFSGEIKADEVRNALRIAEQAISWAKRVLSEKKGEDS